MPSLKESQHFVPSSGIPRISGSTPFREVYQVLERDRKGAFLLLQKDRLLIEDPFLDLLACPPKVLGYVLENRGESSDPKRIVARDRDVVLSGLLRGESQVASCLASQSIAKGSERLGQVLARDVTRKPHTAMSSSRTKWSRISFGLASSSS
jgi:hypothetical protein